MKNAIKKIVPALLSALPFFQSCTYNKYPDPSTITPSSSTATVVSYSATIKPILVTYCLGVGAQTCHVTPSNQGANGDFSTYGGLKAKVTSGTIQSRVFSVSGGMPPSYSSGPASMTPGDLQKFKDWVNQGALNN